MRLRRTAATFTLAALGVALTAPTAVAAAEVTPDALELTLLSTTDTHGNVTNWDYFANRANEGTNVRGLTRVGTVVDEVRAAKGDDSVLVVDNGDAIQGTPLTYYYGMGAGAAGVLDGTTTHPMAQAFNAIGYDAQVVGNHEYNYGLDMLGAYEGDLDAPLLGANVLDVATGEPYHEPYTLVHRTIDGEDVTIGVLGLVTPGVRIWDKANVEGVLEFEDMVEAAKQWVPIVDEQADVVVVLAHTGVGTVSDADYDPVDLNENTVNNIATQVPGIDVMVAGHTHQDAPETIYTNVAGELVLVTQPYRWAQGVTEVTMNLVPDAEAGGYRVDWSDGNEPSTVAHYGSEVAEEDPDVVAALADEHRTTVDYVNTPVARSVTELPAATSRYEDTAIIDFINNVQAETVDEALDAGDLADVPVLSQASPFSRTALFPEGEVTIRDIAGLYIYENTLRGVEMTGAQVKDYLEYSARYFAQVAPGSTFDPETGTNAVYPETPNGIPDYNYDILSGVDYTIDISQPVGSRIVGLAMPDGTPVAADARFVVAVNNYRASGGGGFPHIATAPVVYDELQEIRQLLIDWAGEQGTIDPADFFDPNWTLVTSAAEPTPTPVPTDPTPTPTEPTVPTVPGDPTGPTDAPTPAPAPGSGSGSGAGGAGDGSGNGTAAPGTNVGAHRDTDSGVLAWTGTGSALPLGGLAAVLLALGTGFWLVSRRRTA
ncbi:bifunctional metallophosphatase/5'-nucleotidase [Planctomonas deserti]|uniref:bifunctional metallophosphatase/5'-nucleotidase n=1 Tax=Planctomonas deserti TaxID=2144185 RepID=UPI000D3A8665|nr:5'-nucleotidase C-terminal domain-containing protein [Planctomonas deserti]